MKLKPAGIDSDTGYWQACEHGNAYFGCTKLRSFFSYCARNQKVVQLVEAQQHNTEGRGFDFRGVHWDFFFTYSFRPHYGREVDSASDRNAGKECFLGVKVVGV